MVHSMTALNNETHKSNKPCGSNTATEAQSQMAESTHKRSKRKLQAGNLQGPTRKPDPFEQNSPSLNFYKYDYKTQDNCTAWQSLAEVLQSLKSSMRA